MIYLLLECFEYLTFYTAFVSPFFQSYCDDTLDPECPDERFFRCFHSQYGVELVQPFAHKGKISEISESIRLSCKKNTSGSYCGTNVHSFALYIKKVNTSTDKQSSMTLNNFPLVAVNLISKIFPHFRWTVWHIGLWEWNNFVFYFVVK